MRIFAPVLLIVLGLTIPTQVVSAPAAAPGKKQCDPAWAKAINTNGTLTLSSKPDTALGGPISVYLSTSAEDCTIPTAVGVKVTREALANLPTADEVTMTVYNCTLTEDPTCTGVPSQSIMLYYPLNDTDFSIVTGMYLGWVPNGHALHDVYTAAHIDFHFLLLDLEEYEKIAEKGPCGGVTQEAYEYGNLPIPAECYPKNNYVNSRLFGASVGTHYIDEMDPEVAAALEFKPNISLYNQTWIYGGSGGQISFWEPMLTISWLESLTETVCIDIPEIPERVFKAGYYPRQYCAEPTKEAINVYVTDFVKMEAGCQGSTDYAPGSYIDYMPVNNATQPMPPAECTVVLYNPEDIDEMSPNPAPSTTTTSAGNVVGGGCGMTVGAAVAVLAAFF